MATDGDPRLKRGRIEEEDDVRVLITGGYGQIGSTVAELLLARGDEVVVIDNFATGSRDYLADHPRLTSVEGTIAEEGTVHALFAASRPDAVVHAAASYKDPDDWANDALTNTVGGVNVFRACSEFGVSRVIYFQTSLCYGTKPQQHPIMIDHPRVPVDSSYAISKTAAEFYLELSGLSYVTFRLANVIGPRNVSGPLPVFYERLTAGKACFVTESRRDFVSADDLAPIVVRALDGAGNGPYHFSSGTDVTIRELYDLVVEALELPEYPEPEIRPLGPDDAASILLDPSRTFEEFGDISFTSLRETVRAAVAKYRERGVAGAYTHLKHVGE